MKEDIKYELVVYWSEDDDAYIAEGTGTSRMYGRWQDVRGSDKKTP